MFNGVSIPVEPEERDVKNTAANIRKQLTADKLEYKRFLKHYGTEKQFVEAAKRFSEAHGTAEEWLATLQKCFAADCDVSIQDNITKLHTIARFVATM